MPEEDFKRFVTLYYVYKNTPDSRPGGPWWHKTYDLDAPFSEANIDSLLDRKKSLRPFVEKMAIHLSDTRPVFDDEVKPPEGALHLVGSD